MRKYGSFPIIINYNLHMQLRNNHKEDDLYLAGRREDEKQLYMKTSTTSDETLENGLYKVEIDEYESTVFRCLQTIEGNPVGRMVLGLINKQTVVWIVPEIDAMRGVTQSPPHLYVVWEHTLNDIERRYNTLVTICLAQSREATR